MINLAFGMNKKIISIDKLSDFRKLTILNHKTIDIYNNIQSSSSNPSISLNPKKKEYIADINIFLDYEPFIKVKPFLENKIVLLKKPLNNINAFLSISTPGEYIHFPSENNSLNLYEFQHNLLKELSLYFQSNFLSRDFHIKTSGEFIICLLSYLDNNVTVMLHNFSNIEAIKYNSFGIRVSVDYSRQFDLLKLTKINVISNKFNDITLIIDNKFKNYDDICLHDENIYPNMNIIYLKEYNNSNLRTIKINQCLIYISNEIFIHNLGQFLSIIDGLHEQNIVYQPVNSDNHNFFIYIGKQKGPIKVRDVYTHLDDIKKNSNIMKVIPSRYNSHLSKDDFIIATNRHKNKFYSRSFISIKIYLGKFIIKIFSFLLKQFKKNE